MSNETVLFIRACDYQALTDRAEKAEGELARTTERLREERISWSNEKLAARQLLGEMRNQPEGGRDLLECANGAMEDLSMYREAARRAADERDQVKKSLADVEEKRKAWQARADKLQIDFENACKLGVEHIKRAERLESDVNRLAVENEQNKDARKGLADALQVADRERNEARARLNRFILGSAHGTKCWLDEHGWHCGEGCQAKGARQCKDSKLAKEARKYLKERDEAREQLGRLEWAGRERNGAGRGPQFVARTCPACQSIEPSEHAAQHFPASEIGHRATCWFAKPSDFAKFQATADRYTKIRNHHTKCPARTAEDVTWVDSRWPMPGNLNPPIKGDRPRPIGCDGCECATPPKCSKEEHVARVSDYLKSGRLYIGRDFGTKTVQTFSLVEWAIGAPKKSPPQHPRFEPRFKVGDIVMLGQSEVEVKRATWHALFSCWTYQVGDMRADQSERALKPAPKFAVGEWVKSWLGDGETEKRIWEADLGWVYGLVRDDQNWRAREGDLVAQTPQYKHDCAGCVFLGRYGSLDLWLGVEFDGIHYVVASAGQWIMSLNGLASDGHKEAIRRAKIRGLV